MISSRLLLFALLVCGVAAANPAAIGFEKKWKQLELPETASNEYTADGETLTVRSDNSADFYYRKLLSAKQLDKANWQLSWEWRVLESTKAVATNTTEADDRPLAVHLWINDRKSVGWFKGGLAKLFGIPTPGFMLTWSWGGTETVGSEFANPHLPEGRGLITIAAAGATAMEWQQQTVNVNDAISNLLTEVNDRIYLVISADNDGHGGRSVAQVRNLRLTRIAP
ncbi:MAG: DUF3047 domain-containing protein [Gammaproteobacteria bacterium]|nr:DUF3047 domain-containing protein [Gammaproteobacteria bacterium]